MKAEILFFFFSKILFFLCTSKWFSTFHCLWTCVSQVDRPQLWGFHSEDVKITLYFGHVGALWLKSRWRSPFSPVWLLNVSIKLCLCSLAQRGWNLNNTRCLIRDMIIWRRPLLEPNRRLRWQIWSLYSYFGRFICRHYKNTPNNKNGARNARCIGDGCFNSVRVFCGGSCFSSHFAESGSG